MSDETTLMFRPVGPTERKLLEDSGWTRWPARLPEQPFFYPVTNEAYATEIASNWNVKQSGAGYVTRFRVRTSFMSRYQVHQVGASYHTEWWIPAQDVEELNRNLVGKIELVSSFEQSSEVTASHNNVRVEESPYTHSELRQDPQFPPLRGLLCPHCEMRIPQFADVAGEALARVLQHIEQGRMLHAIRELRMATDCSLAFAHLWVVHRGKAEEPEGEAPTPCPFCGKPLRTSRSKQCRHCKLDWHDPERVHELGSV